MSIEFTTTQKALILGALGDVAVRVRTNGTWYASVRADIKREGLLESPGISEPTPDAAIDALFRAYTAPGAVIVRDAGRSTQRELILSGFMWEDAE